MTETFAEGDKGAEMPVLAPAQPYPGPPWMLVIQLPDEEALIGSLEAMPDSVVALAFCADVALQVETFVTSLPTYERKVLAPTAPPDPGADVSEP